MPEEAQQEVAPTPGEVSALAAGLAGIMLSIGVPKDRIPEVWKAMELMSVVYTPMEAVEVVEAAYELSKKGMPLPTNSPDTGTVADDRNEVSKQIQDAITKAGADESDE